ncbi:MAG: hypothetical protein AAGC54_17260 [Cyanobacteria bacterium P01_F01_bin.4]
MQYFSEAYIQEHFDFSKLSSAFRAVLEVASRDPITWYLFLHRYSHFNSYAAAAATRLASSIALSRYTFMTPGSMVREESDYGANIAEQLMTSILDGERVSRRRLVQSVLKAAGDYAGLLPDERNLLLTLPDWLSHLEGEFVRYYEGQPGRVVSLLNAAGVHAASDVSDTYEQRLLGQFMQQTPLCGEFFEALSGHLSADFLQDRQTWCRLVGRGPWQGLEGTEFTGIQLLETLVQYRSESSFQLQCWIFEGFAMFMGLQQRLLDEIYRECLELNPIYECAGEWAGAAV